YVARNRSGRRRAGVLDAAVHADIRDDVAAVSERKIAAGADDECAAVAEKRGAAVIDETADGLVVAVQVDRAAAVEREGGGVGDLLVGEPLKSSAGVHQH